MTTPQADEPSATLEEVGTAQSSRWERLLALLADQERLSVTEAAATLGVSESTIRRDFDQMAKSRLARRTHGGIVAATVAYNLPSRYTHLTPHMERITHAAAQLLLERFPSTATIGINGGRTTTEFAEEIGRLTDAHTSRTSRSAPRLTVVSSALNIASALVLRPQIRIVSLGGVVRSRSYELTGPIATEAMSSLWLDCMVLGFVGLDASFGATCSDTDEAAVTRTMIEHSETILAVGTSEKIGKRSFARICKTPAINTLITDKGLNRDQLKLLKSAKVEVIAV